MRIRRNVIHLLWATLVACALMPMLAASAATRPEGVVFVNACQRSSNYPIQDGDFTLSSGGDAFTISDNVQITSMQGIAGVSWNRWYAGPGASWRSASYVTLTCRGDLQFWHSPTVLVWHTGTSGSGAAHLILNAKGELLLYTADWSRIVWRSHSGQRYLPAGTVLPSGGRLASTGADVRSYVLRTLVMQADGNLEYRVGGVLRWQSNTHVAGSHAALNTHAQLVVIGPAGRLLWSSRVTGSRDSVLDVELMEVDDLSYGVARTIWRAPGA